MASSVERVIASLQRGQARLFAEQQRLRDELADAREALGVRDRAIERLGQQLTAVHVELNLERLRREGHLPPAPARPELVLT